MDERIMKCFFATIAVITIMALSGCASSFGRRDVKQSASIVSYLFPNASETPKMNTGVTYLRPPVRVGLAFVPTVARGNELPETERIRLLERVRDSFARAPYIGSIEIIPTAYLRPGGGFADMEQVARMFNVEVMAMVSYDQVQFNDSNALSFLYWTIIGAYVIQGDQYDVRTMLDVSVFDVTSRTLLMRAPGTSQVNGSATLAGYSARARQAQVAGYNKAVDALAPALQTELDRFRERIKTEANFRVEAKPGYRGGGSVDWLSFAVVALVVLGWWAARRRKTDDVISRIPAKAQTP